MYTLETTINGLRSQRLQRSLAVLGTLFALAHGLVDGPALAQEEQKEDDVLGLLEEEEKMRKQSSPARKPPETIGAGPVSSSGEAAGVTGQGEGGSAHEDVMDRTPPVNAYATQQAWNKPYIPGSGQYNPGVVVINYRKDKIDEIIVRPGISTAMIFPEWEIVTPVELPGSLFPAAVDIYVDPDDPNIAHITPREYTGVDGSITLLGRPYASRQGSSFSERNVYQFFVKSVPVDYQDKTDLKVIIRAMNPLVPESKTVKPTLADLMEKARFKAEPLSSEPPDFLREVGVELASLRFTDYRMFVQKDEDREIAPLKIFHDGRFTYFDFGEKRIDQITMPAVYQVIDNVDTPVNSYISGPSDNIIVAQAVGDFSLKHGTRVVCIRCAAEGLCRPAAPNIELIGRK